LKNFLLFASVTLVFAGSAAVLRAEDGAKDAAVAPIVYTAQSAQPASFSPDQIKTVGTIDNGQTTTVVESPGSAKYRALVFEGNGHDQVDISVTGVGARQAYVALADSTLTPIASAMGHLVTSLPYHGPDTEAFYILVKGSPNQRMVVHLKQTRPAAATPAAADATR
jgi:hypothetical protein